MVLLPLLIMMLSGLIEFGFLLNYYLDLIDGTRELARFGANLDPLTGPEVFNCTTTKNFYELLGCLADQVFDKEKQQINLDLVPNDIVVSAFGAKDGFVTERYPDADGWSFKGRKVSKFTTDDINGMLDINAPATGMVLVEVFYEYNMILGLPWITMFVPDTIPLHAYSIMPNTYVEPTPVSP